MLKSTRMQAKCLLNGQHTTNCRQICNKLCLSVTQILPEEINKMLSLTNLGFINENLTVCYLILQKGERGRVILGRLCWKMIYRVSQGVQATSTETLK